MVRKCDAIDCTCLAYLPQGLDADVNGLDLVNSLAPLVMIHPYTQNNSNLVLSTAAAAQLIDI